MLKLNLGCGPHAMNGWVNYDSDPYPRAKMLDLSMGCLPHDTESVDFIFSEHFLEHVEKREAISLLRECHRVLRPEGTLRFSTPDLDYLLDNYYRWRNQGQLNAIPSVWSPKTPCDMVNEGMREWGHKYLWDKSELVSVLKDVGFRSIWDCAWHKSIHLELKDIEVRPYYGEIIIEASKKQISYP